MINFDHTVLKFVRNQNRKKSRFGLSPQGINESNQSNFKSRLFLSLFCVEIKTEEKSRFKIKVLEGVASCY